MKKILFPSVAFFVILIGISFASADEFKMPFDPDNLVDHWVDVVFREADNGGMDVIVVHTSTFHYDNLVEVPDSITVQTVDNNDSIIGSIVVTLTQSAEKILDPIPEPTKAEELGISEESMARLDEKRAEDEKIAEEALRCVLGIEGSSIFTEYRELQVLKHMIYFKQLPISYQERQIILWTEECRVWNESYISKSPEYRDKYLAERDNPAYSKVLDESDSLATDPLTKQDFLDEIEDSEKFMCSQEGKQRGLCIGEFEGINRGGFKTDSQGNIIGAECLTQLGKTMCPEKDYNELISSAISAEENYTEIQKLVCEKFLSQYSALVERIKAGDESAQLPNWLAHCEIE